MCSTQHATAERASLSAASDACDAAVLPASVLILGTDIGTLALTCARQREVLDVLQSLVAGTGHWQQAQHAAPTEVH